MIIAPASNQVILGSDMLAPIQER